MATVRRGRRAASGFLRDFQEFALKGNVVDLAIGVVIGAAFGKIVTSFVEDVIMPLLNPLVEAAGKDWRTIEIGPGVKIGSFLGSIVDFLIIALVIYLVIRALARLKRQEEAVEEGTPDPAVQSQERLTSAIERLTQTLESQHR
jgi:large conductance mechanosensitive channel